MSVSDFARDGNGLRPRRLKSAMSSPSGEDASGRGLGVGDAVASPSAPRTKKAPLPSGAAAWGNKSAGGDEQNPFNPNGGHLSRITTTTSKKFENIQAAVSPNFAYNNFLKAYGAIRMTPALAAGVENSAWTISELIERCGE